MLWCARKRAIASGISSDTEAIPGRVDTVLGEQIKSTYADSVHSTHREPGRLQRCDKKATILISFILSITRVCERLEIMYGTYTYNYVRSPSVNACSIRE